VSLYLVLERTANVRKTYRDAGFTLRGINSNDGEGAPLSTIWLDGTAMSPVMTAGGSTTLWDLAQAEILRGPQ
jgi:iron complex outermembrane receptor protein